MKKEEIKRSALAEKEKIKEEARVNGFETDLLYPTSMTLKTTYVVRSQAMKERLIRIINNSFTNGARQAFCGLDVHQ